MAKSTNTSQTGKVWFISGTSTGFGRLLAEEVLKAGGKVVATARMLDKVADLEREYPQTTLALDATAGNMRKYFAENVRKSPLRLLRGASALQRLRTKISNWEKEIAAWQQVTIGADFPEGT